MKVILIFVTSLDGRITKWEDPMVRKWSSLEDQEYFSATWKSSELVVAGSATYDADPLRPVSGRRIIIMTSHPSRYIEHQVPGQLEFTDESPGELVSRCQSDGYREMLVVGGARIATSFLKERLVDELWLTIEPKLFGSGTSLVSGERLDIDLKLLSCEQVNGQGTLITKYHINRKV